MIVLKILLTLAVMGWSVGAVKFWSNYSIDAVQYFKMPELNKFSDYDECMAVFGKEAKYCFVKTALKPDDSSDLYKYIKEFSEMKKQHFRHDKLTRGVCLNTCSKIISEIGLESDKYFVPKFSLDYSITFDFIEFANSSEDRENFNQIVNQCVNMELERYNLSGYSSIEYCVQYENPTKIDSLDIFFIVALTLLLSVIYMSSAYDEKLRIATMRTDKIKLEADEYYKLAPAALNQKFLVSFSFIRNWYLLSAPTREDMRDLRSISAVRIWTMIAIIYGHCSWFTIAVPIQNPIYVEQSYHRLWSMLVINGGNLVQSFFFVSGFLNSIVFLAYVNKNKVKNFGILVKTIIYRYIRFAPVLLFFVLLHSTWLYRFQTGPFWDKFNFYERQACRENMWTNLLFINNYVSGDLKCLVHTWFISTDLHLSIIATAILLIVVNLPQHRYKILYGSIGVSLIISFVHFYVYELEPILILTPETLRNQLVTTSPYDRYFFEFHSPTHLNTGNYLIGLIIGYYYYEFKQAGHRHRRNIFYHVLWHFSWILTFVLCFIGIYFYEHDIEKGVWSALIGTVLKHIYGPILGVLLVGIFFRYGGFIPKIYNYGMYRILARLSFSVYMVHVTVGSLIITGQSYPLEINHAVLCAFTSGVYVLSHAAAVCLVICIELPAHVIYKTIMNEIIDKPKKTEDGKTNHAFNDCQATSSVDITKF